MMVKIMSKDNLSYRLFDSLSDINVSEILNKNDFLRVDNTLHADAVIITDLENTKCRKFTWMFNNEKEQTLVFDTVAYIMNDSGKTIEKIVVE